MPCHAIVSYFIKILDDMLLDSGLRLNSMRPISSKHPRDVLADAPDILAGILADTPNLYVRILVAFLSNTLDFLVTC